MAEFLIIRLGHGAEDPAEWIAVDSDGTRLGPPVTGPLGEARRDLGERRAIVIVPGPDVVSTSAEIPVKSGARLQAALPFALEESVAEDVEHLHFAAGRRRENGRLPVAIVSKARMAEWLERLAEAGIDPVRLVPEQYGLGRIPGTVSLLVDDDLVLANDGSDTDLALQHMTPGEALVVIGALPEDNIDAAEHDGDDSSSDTPRHVLIYCTPGDDERYRHDWIALRQELDSVDVKLLPDGALPRMAATVATADGVNLLQGSYGPRTEYRGLLAPWRYAAALLLALLLVGTAAKAVNYVALSREEAALREQFMTEYRQFAPGAPEVEDPVRLVSSLRARAGGTAGTPQILLQALESLGTAMQTGIDARIDAISFRGGVADIRLNAANVSVLDDIRQRIDGSGRFSARIQSTDQVGERVDSRIQMQATTP
ncbi:MAG: type II secretion system protein GspL [Woeseiaceae bacterium]|nr:type II secretion system protein GspL [Woeseiaceae bacterium]